MKKLDKFFIATIMTVLTSSTILSGGINISEATTSSQEDKMTQQQLQEKRQQQRIAQQQQKEQQQQLQTQAVQTQAALEKKPITTADIADNAVTSPKIASGGVTTSDIANGAVTIEKLNPDAVTPQVTPRFSDPQTLAPAGSAGSINFVRVQCQAGEVMTGGGFNSGTGVEVSRSNVEGIFWRVDGTNTASENKAIIAMAMCLSP